VNIIKKTIIIIILLTLIGLPLSVNAQTNKATIVMDLRNGRIIHQENINEPLLVASTAKIMTAVIIIERGNLDKKILIDKRINQSYGSSINLVSGEYISRYDLLHALLLRSANDAALALAIDYADNEASFATIMNQKAKEIGLANTIFKNSSGLDDINQNKMSALDLAILYKYAMKNPIFRKIIATKKYQLNTNVHQFNLENKNKLLKYKSATGGKSGYTSRSGQVLVTSTKRGATELLIITINYGYYKRHIQLYKQYWEQYYSPRLINKDKYKIPKNKYYANNQLIVKDDFVYLVTKEELSKVTRKLVITNKTKKPNKKVGYIYLKLNKKYLGQVSVYTKPKQV